MSFFILNIILSNSLFCLFIHPLYLLVKSSACTAPLLLQNRESASFHQNQRRGLDALQMVSSPSRANLRFDLFRPVPISSCQGAVLSRRPVAERRHFGRVFCGLTCPLRYAPSESAAAVITQRLDSGLREQLNKTASA